MERQQNVLDEVVDRVAPEGCSSVRHDPANSWDDAVQELAVRRSVASLRRLHGPAQLIIGLFSCVHALRSVNSTVYDQT